MRRAHTLARFAASAAAIAFAAVNTAVPVSAATNPQATKAPAAMKMAAPMKPMATKAPINIGMIDSKTGFLSVYVAQFESGLKAGIDYLTQGTGIVDGHKLVFTEEDDAGAPATGVTEAKGLIGQGYKILVSGGSSGVAASIAPLAKENQVLYISGAAAYDGLTGANRYTFRAGRQTAQDVATAAQIMGDPKGKTVVVFAQDTLFGKANYAAVQHFMGGATVTPVFAPLSANDFSPFAQKLKDLHPDMLFIAWAGTTGAAMWKALDDQGVLASTKVVTGMDGTYTYPLYATIAPRVTFLAHYFMQCCNNAMNKAMIAAYKKQGQIPEIFSGDGWVTAEMLVHAIQKSDGTDVEKMIGALEGWTFAAPKGGQTIRIVDHAMLQPMFISKLVGPPTALHPVLIKTLSPLAVAPPITPFK